jgi:hypothetical protein
MPGSCNLSIPLVDSADYGGTELLDFGHEVHVDGQTLNHSAPFYFAARKEVEIEVVASSSGFRVFLLALDGSGVDARSFSSADPKDSAFRPWTRATPS